MHIHKHPRDPPIVRPARMHHRPVGSAVGSERPMAAVAPDRQRDGDLVLHTSCFRLHPNARDRCEGARSGPAPAHPPVRRTRANGCKRGGRR